MNEINRTAKDPLKEQLRKTKGKGPRVGLKEHGRLVFSVSVCGDDTLPLINCVVKALRLLVFKPWVRTCPLASPRS